MEKRQAVTGVCPLCDKPYSVENNRTKHHIFPTYWRKNGDFGNLKNGITVYACERCHEKEFNALYPMHLKEPWTKVECLLFWVDFCYRKGKNAIEVYPQLRLINL